MHEKHIQSTKRNADVVVKNEYNPQIEAKRSGLHEVQLKFQADIDPEMIRKLGAETLGSTVQIDYYYNPTDRDLRKTDEMVRIREEAGRRILAYKGPRVKEKQDFRMRPKFEFEIDEETERAFLGIYGDRVKVIKKQRTLYQLHGVVFSLDSVLKNEGGKDTHIGEFLEIRATDKQTDTEAIELLIEELGLKKGDGIKTAYAEM